MVNYSHLMNPATRDIVSSETPTYSAPSAVSKPARKPIQVVRRLKDDVCLSQETSARGEDDSAGSLCSNFMAAWG